MKVTNAMVDRFLQWPLPHSVCADLCATKQGPGRIGTNLLTATEAQQMLEFVLGPPPAPNENETPRRTDALVDGIEARLKLRGFGVPEDLKDALHLCYELEAQKEKWAEQATKNEQRRWETQQTLDKLIVDLSEYSQHDDCGVCRGAGCIGIPGAKCDACDGAGKNRLALAFRWVEMEKKVAVANEKAKTFEKEMYIRAAEADAAKAQVERVTKLHKGLMQDKEAQIAALSAR